jgi:hypothetical protein
MWSVKTHRFKFLLKRVSTDEFCCSFGLNLQLFIRLLNLSKIYIYILKLIETIAYGFIELENTLLYS